MEKENLTLKKGEAPQSATAPDEGNAPVREKLSDPKDLSDVLKQRAEVAKRAMEYGDANAEDFEDD
jgi:hypothetical protein